MSRQSPPAIASYPTIVGNLMAQLRDGKGINQGEVADAVGLTQATWSRIESGSSALTIEQLAEFAAHLGLKPHEILRDADDAVEDLKKRNIRVEPKRQNWDLDSGWVLVGIAVVAVVIAAVLAKKK